MLTGVHRVTCTYTVRLETLLHKRRLRLSLIQIRSECKDGWTAGGHDSFGAASHEPLAYADAVRIRPLEMPPFGIRPRVDAPSILRWQSLPIGVSVLLPGVGILKKSISIRSDQKEGC